jgi:hypothetical protein
MTIPIARTPRTIAQVATTGSRAFRNAKSSLICRLVASEATSAPPRYALKPASVTMNAGTPSHAVHMPCHAPIAAPTSKAAKIAHGADSPSSRCTSAATTPVSATVAPADRSMPRIRTTNVMPTATISNTEYCESSVAMLPWVRNVPRVPGATASTSHIAASTPAIAHRLRSSLRLLRGSALRSSFTMQLL